jgi:hypothetical protein
MDYSKKNQTTPPASNVMNFSYGKLLSEVGVVAEERDGRRTTRSSTQHRT